MKRQEWYSLYHDVRTGIDGANLFPRGDMDVIARIMAREDRKDQWKMLRAASNASKAQD